jgi:uncharacterized membrane protein YjfL (UPF0719 family)
MSLQPAAPTVPIAQFDQILRTLVSALAFSALGLVLFAVAFLIIVKVSPFSLRKEIEEDQNTALAIIIASVIIGIALIVSSAIHG